MLAIIGKTPAIIHFAHILTIMDLSGESLFRRFLYVAIGFIVCITFRCIET